MADISLIMETGALADIYEAASENQYKAGLVLLEQLKFTPGEIVLDVGCGTGRLGVDAADLVGPHGKVTGIDPLATRIQIASKRARENLSFLVGDALDLSIFASASFDVVYLNAVFHWLPDKARALHEFARVLKPNGRLGITTGSGDHPYPHEILKERVMARERYRSYIESTKGDASLPTKKHLESLLHDAGFQCQSIFFAPHVLITKSASEMVDFIEASSFGNFLGHLPNHLRSMARQEIEEEYEQLRTDEGIVAEATRLIVVANKIQG
ncbi:hypothetical protein FE257_011887 [Aspergillus nanangensis]|uniref:Methyltransferase domain-containing protein n=1 Tax=Aspergillus nanangensis TaxID=2582783 RepID=A0AAD4GQF8_ASPNN|nr:hypothetical protein FE257_011887 [Aspergillus nanangensis]